MANLNVSELENNKTYKKALEMHSLGDGIGAIKLFTELSEEGHMLAQYQLAKIYLDEHNNTLEGMRLFELAGKQGDVNSAFNLGTIFENGNLVAQSLADAYFWYRIAARGGDEESQEILNKIDSEVYDDQSDTFEYSLDGRLYWEIVGPAAHLQFYLQESDANNEEIESLTAAEEQSINELMVYLKSRWPEEYQLASITTKKEGRDNIYLSDLSEQIGQHGYSYLADIIEFLKDKNIFRPCLMADDLKNTGNELAAKLDLLLAKFDQIMADEYFLDASLNRELAIKANKLAFNDYDPDLNTEVELVLYLRDIYPVEFGQAILNQSLDEGEDVEFPTLGRIAELIDTENESIFLKNIEKFYSSKGYKK